VLGRRLDQGRFCLVHQSRTLIVDPIKSAYDTRHRSVGTKKEGKLGGTLTPRPTPFSSSALHDAKHRFFGKESKMSTKFSIVGSSPKRIDGLEKVTGYGKYAADILLPGMLYGKIKRSPHAHARIVGVDTSRARQFPGVKAILSVENVPRRLHAGAPPPRISSVWRDQYIFDKKVRFVGEGVAAVAAVTEDIAAEALDQIEVEYEPLPAVFEADQAMQAEAPAIHDTERNLVIPPVQVTRGNVEQGFAQADYIFEGEYSTGRPMPCYMEPNACVCQFDLSGKLTIWSSTQCAFMVRGILSEVLDIPTHSIRVIVDHMGGGFGAKQDLFQHEFICALLARESARPVKMEYTRQETFLAGRSRHPVRVYLKQGVTQDGTITARQVRYVANSGAYGSHGPGITRVGSASLTSLYRCANISVEGLCAYTNTPISGAYRGYGVVQSYFALDCQLDEIAEQLGMDPVELKLKNAVGDGDISPSGHPLIGHGLAACLKRGAAEVGWYDRKSAAAQPNGPKLRGWGMATEMHGSSAYPGIKEQSNAIIRMNEDGTVHLLTGTAGLGTGAHTALSQIVAEELGLPFENVRVIAGDTDVVPFDIGAYASRTTFLGRRRQSAGLGSGCPKIGSRCERPDH
jgi:xanthine dehydrogenase molybdenum-binding subunit